MTEGFRTDYSRKSPKEIKMLIVDTCWAKAENKLVIAKALNSNWSTIGKYAEELANDGVLERVVVSDLVGYKVKQIIKDVLCHQWENKDEGLDFAFEFDKYNKELEKKK